MKNLILVGSFILLILSQNMFAQSTEQQIAETIDNYIQGSSFNYPDRLSKAFNPGAELFLDGRDDKLRVMKAEEYVALFSKHPAGQVNNRIGEILSIEAYGKTAVAKVEIIMPNSKRRFIDYFILKLIDGNWKIASKAASSQESNLNGRRVLLVVSNAHFHGKSQISAGNSFGEIVDAYSVFKGAGFTIDFVSPSGGAVPLTYIDTSEELYKTYLYNPDFMYALGHTKQATRLSAKNYEAVYYVGGSSVIYDIPQDKPIQKLTEGIYQNLGVVAAVCHGTAGLVDLKTANGEYLLAGKNITGYSEKFEKQDADYFKQFPLLIEQSVQQRQGKFITKKRHSEHVQVDGRVVTGQNANSAKLTAQKVVNMLLGKS
jgi:putative intracellular protease/amidase